MRAAALGLVVLVACGPAAVSAVPGTGPATEDLYHRERIRRSFEEFFNRTDQEQAILHAKINASVHHHRDLVHQEIALLNTLLQAEGGSTGIFTDVKTPKAAVALNAKSDEEAEHNDFVTIQISDTHEGKDSTAETWVEQNGDGDVKSANAERSVVAADEDAGDQTELATSMEKELARSRVDGANDEDETKRWLAANKARRDRGVSTAAQEAVGKRELAYAEGRAAAAAAILARVKAEAEEAETKARDEEELAKKWAKEADDKRMAASQREAEARQAFAQLAEVREEAKDTASNSKAKHLEEVASKVLNAATAVQNAANKLQIPMTDNRTASGASSVVEGQQEGGRQDASTVKGAEEMVLEKEKELVRAREKLASAKIDERAKTLEAEEARAHHHGSDSPALPRRALAPPTDENRSNTPAKYPQRTLAPALAKVMNGAIADLDSDRNASAAALQYAAAEAEEADKASEVAEIMLESERKSAADIEALEAEEARTVKHGAIVKMEMEKAKARMAAQKKEAAIAALHASFLKAEAESVAAIAARTAAVAKRDMAAADATWANHEIVNLIAEADSEARTNTLERSRKHAWELSAKKPKMALFAENIAEDSAVKTVDEFTKTSANSKVAQRAQARLEAAKQVQAAAKADLKNAVKAADKAMAIAKTEQEMATRAEAGAASAKQHQEQAEEAARAARAQSEWAQHTAQTWILEGKKTADEIKKVTEKIQEANATAAAALANANAAAKMYKEAAKTKKVEKAMADMGLEEANAQMSKTADKKAALGKADQEVEAARLMLAKIVHMDKKKEPQADKKAQDVATSLAQKHIPERRHHRDAEVSMRTKATQDLNASWVENMANWVFGKPPAPPEPAARKGREGRRATSLAVGMRADGRVARRGRKGRDGREATALAKDDRAEPVAKNGAKGREAISLAKDERVVKRAAEERAMKSETRRSKRARSRLNRKGNNNKQENASAPVQMPVAAAETKSTDTSENASAPVQMPVAAAETKSTDTSEVASHDVAAPNESGFAAWAQDFLAQGYHLNVTTPMPPLPADTTPMPAPPAQAEAGKNASAPVQMPVAAAETKSTDTSENVDTSGSMFLGTRGKVRSLVEDGSAGKGAIPQPPIAKAADTSWAGRMSNQMFGKPSPKHLDTPVTVNSQELVKGAKDTLDTAMAAQAEAEKAAELAATDRNWVVKAADAWLNEGRSKTEEEVASTKAKVQAAEDAAARAAAAAADAKEKVAEVIRARESVKEKAKDLKKSNSSSSRSTAMGTQSSSFASQSGPHSSSFGSVPRSSFSDGLPLAAPVESHSRPPPPNSLSLANSKGSHRRTYEANSFSPEPASGREEAFSRAAPSSPFSFGSKSYPGDSYTSRESFSSPSRPYSMERSTMGSVSSFTDPRAPPRPFSSPSSPYPSQGVSAGSMSSPRGPHAAQTPFSSPSSPYSSRRSTMGSADFPADPYASQKSFPSSRSGPHWSQSSSLDSFSSPGSFSSRTGPFSPQSSPYSSQPSPRSAQSNPYAPQGSLSPRSSSYSSHDQPMGSPASLMGPRRSPTAAEGSMRQASAAPASDGDLFGALFGPKTPNHLNHQKSRDIIQMEKRKQAEKEALKREAAMQGERKRISEKPPEDAFEQTSKNPLEAMGAFLRR